MKVFLDPGHGGNDRANRGPTGYIEADGALDISLRLSAILRAYGHDVKLSREEDQSLTLTQRAQMSNAWGADLLISIHSNAASDPAAGGVETFHTLRNLWGDKDHARARERAQKINSAVVEATGWQNRGIKTRTGSTGLDYYGIIRQTNAPALIVEVGFHSNPREEAELKKPEFRQKVAQAIADAIGKVETMSDFYINGQAADPRRIVQSGVTYVALRDVLDPLGIPVHYDATTKITYVGSRQEAPEPTPSPDPVPTPQPPVKALYTWTGQATRRGNVILAKAKPTDVYVRVKRSTPYTEPSFDGINCVFYNPADYALLGVLYDQGKVHCNGVDRVPPRACLVGYKDGTAKIVQTKDFNRDLGPEKARIHFAVGGYSADLEIRKTENVDGSARPTDAGARRTFIGYRTDGTIIAGCTAVGMTLAQLDKLLEDVFESNRHYILLDGGGSTGCYFYNKGKPIYVQSRIVPALLGFAREK